MYRCDRRSEEMRRGGGVSILVHNNIRSRGININYNINSKFEQLFVTISQGNLNFVIGAVYIPPRSNQEVYLEHTQIVEQLQVSLPNHQFIICGDYNLPEAIWWCTDGVFLADFPHNSAASVVHECFNFLNIIK